MADQQEITVKNKQEVTRDEATRPGRTFMPDVDIYETPEALYLWADVPGVDDKHLNVQLADGILTIEGEVSVAEYVDLSPVYTEYNVGNYSRRFALSNDVDPEGIKARVNNGVLELVLPKSERAKPRKIEVAAS